MPWNYLSGGVSLCASEMGDCKLKTIPQGTLKHIEALTSALAEKGISVANAVAMANEAIGDHNARIAETVADYNATMSDLRTTCNDIFEEADAYYDGRAEKWQDSEAGCAYAQWKENIGNAIDDLEDLEIDDIEEIDEPDLFDSEQWEGLPPSPEEV